VKVCGTTPLFVSITVIVPAGALIVLGVNADVATLQE